MFVFYMLPAVVMLACTAKMMGIVFAAMWILPMVWTYVLGHKHGLNYVIKKMEEIRKDSGG